MRSRILELADIAGKSNPTWDIPDEFSEKLAELIVKECAKLSYRFTSNPKNIEHYNEFGWECLPGDIQIHIKEYFGVE